MTVPLLITVLTAAIAAVTSGQRQYDLRLIGGSSDLEGRVEVYIDGAWGTVCDDLWDIDDATVVCWQLGYGKAISAPGSAHFGLGSGKIVYDEVTCKGTETRLHKCTMNYTNDCSHYKDAGVVCSQPDEYDLRLVGGFNKLEGRVEVYAHGSWGTVCDHGWDLNDAAVACRQLGYAEAISAPLYAFFGSGSGSIHFDDVACTGTEQELHECYQGAYPNCDHYDDAGVVCSNHTNRPAQYDVRLADGWKYYEGRVEVYVDGAWQGTICKSTWDIEDATVVCRQLGFLQPEPVSTDTFFGIGNRTTLFTSVTCTGTEKNLQGCSLSNHSSAEWGCSDAAVVCNDHRPDQYAVRLVGNVSSDLEGRVEVFVDGAWGTVCDNGWDVDDATVVCWQLGYGKAKSAPGSAFFGKGSGDVIFDLVNCQGTESHLHECTYTSSFCGHDKDAGVVCSQTEEYDVRLVGGSSKLEGRVEVFVDGTWGTICSIGWEMKDGMVVCRQLGYKMATSAPKYAHFGQGSGAIALQSVVCVGTESNLQLCSAETEAGYCLHNDDAGVVCTDTLSDYDVRLMNGFGNLKGRVEVFVDGAWGTVCQVGWDIRAATVVCRQLGYQTAIYALKQFGPGSGEILVNGVRCEGTESHLRECALNTGVYDCTHAQDAGVVCDYQDYDIRLVGGSSILEGRVEVLIFGAWGTVCDRDWDINDATVVCRQLGFQKARSASTQFGPGNGLIIFRDVACDGTESRFYDCTWKDGLLSSCTHAEDAGVVCDEQEYGVRLVGGHNEHEGRVEVFVGDAWGTICDVGWDIDDATVVCRQLGYGEATSAPGSATFGQGSGTIVYSNAACKGGERRLNDCSISTNGHLCNHIDDAGVECSASDTAEQGSVRLVDGSSQYEGRVEIYLDGQWGTICDGWDSWNKDAADVVCQQLGYGYADSAESESTFGPGPGRPILMDNVICLGDESRLDECRYDNSPTCTHQSDVGVRCRGNRLSMGAIAGIVVGVFMAVAVGVGAVIRFCYSRVRRTGGGTPAASREEATCQDANATLGAIYYTPYKEGSTPYTTVAQPSNHPQVPPNNGSGMWVITPEA